MPNTPRPATTADSSTPQVQITSPWGQASIAWANGKTVFAPLFKITVRRKHPRTQFITLGADTRVPP